MKNILVIDDDPGLVAYFQRRLGSLGYGVMTASTAEEGLLRAREARPDLMIVDVMMPGMDGFSFVREVRSDDALAAVPVLVVTAREELGDLFKMEGVQGFFPKPVDTDAMLWRIQVLLE